MSVLPCTPQRSIARKLHRISIVSVRGAGCALRHRRASSNLRESLFMTTPRAGGTNAGQLMPGAREPGMLTMFGGLPVSSGIIPDGPSTMDATTIAEHQREGGGAPNQRRPAGAGWRQNGFGHRLHRFLVATGVLSA